MKRLYVLYDAECGLCTLVRQWAEAQPALVELDFVAAQSARALQWFPTLAHAGRPEELIVVSDDGGVYREDSSWIMVLYALAEYRAWAVRLSRPALLPFAREAFALLTRNRERISVWLGLLSDRDLAAQLRREVVPRCERGGLS
jgi:predicted DCC family thiol-disulfide oxidoreductase YuxK